MPDNSSLPETWYDIYSGAEGENEESNIKPESGKRVVDEVACWRILDHFRAPPTIGTLPHVEEGTPQEAPCGRLHESYN